MKKRPVLHISLDRERVERDFVAPSTYRRSFYRERDERLERALQHPATWQWALWCQENYMRKRRCNTLLAEVYSTSEGPLWEARIEGIAEGDKAFREMAPPGAETTKIPPGLHARHVWLDDGDADLIAQCARHGLIVVKRSALNEALARGKSLAHARDGRVTFIRCSMA